MVDDDGEEEEEEHNTTYEEDKNINSECRWRCMTTSMGR